MSIGDTDVDLSDLVKNLSLALTLTAVYQCTSR